MIAQLLREATGSDMAYQNIIIAGYLISSVFFIMTLSGLSNQESAKKGNWYGVVGMAFGILLASTDAWNLSIERNSDITQIIGTILAMVIPAGCIGVYVALKVVMTSMPELIACLHSFVGLAATLIGFGSFFAGEPDENAFSIGLHRMECYLGIFIGSVTFTGSLIAFGKLSARINSKPLLILGEGRHLINIGIVTTAVISMGCYMYGMSWEVDLFNLLLNATLSGALGVHMIMAIGGADMPVVVSMLNSYSGWATAASGLMLSNLVLVVSGALVGSSGAILSYIMCRAMNRSFVSVILGGFGEGVGPATTVAIEGELKEINQKDAAKLMADAKSIIVVPGYGMAAGKAQHAVAQIAKTMRTKGCNFRFAVHPVAGRLPGHMNVLLAEARVPYDIVQEMDHINSDFPKTDVAIVLGANDIVNPSAQEDPSSPIAGMPVLEVWKAKTTIVIKRGKGTGYAGVENPLFYKANTRMLYGNALSVCEKLLVDIKELSGVVAEQARPAETTPLATGASPAAAASFQAPDVFPTPVHSVAVPREVMEGECRVAATPDSVIWMRKMAFSVFVEAGAGVLSKFSDEDYVRAGAVIVEDVAALYAQAEIVIKVRPPMLHPVLKQHEATLLRQNQVLISMLYPARNPDLIKQLCAAQATVMGMDLIPRISRAQKCDVLSSMAGITGYRSVVEAANYFPRYMTGQITAAGTVKPAKVLIIGAGVAGLAAIGAAKGLGAIVRAFDTRSAAREQIESMGGEFLTVSIQEEGETAGGYSKAMSDLFLQKELELFAAQAPEVDVIISTALIPNRPAPRLVTEAMVSTMRNGSVIVDLAAESGGNCELTQPGQTIRTSNGVTIVGETDLVSKMATQASQMYSNNICHLLDEMGKGTNFAINEKNDIIYGALAILAGELKWDPNRKPIPTAAPKAAAAAPAAAPAAKPAALAAPTATTTTGPGPAVGKPAAKVDWFFWFQWGLFAAFIVGLLVIAPMMVEEMLIEIVIFVFAIFIGYMVIWNVTPALHTPLMSVTNAVSGIIVCGGIVELTGEFFGAEFIFGMTAVFLASINIFGGFVVTHRMLQMFVLEKNQ